MSKTWFITGTSRGFGRLFAEAALQRGDRVAATARSAESLADLAERYGERVLPLALDVTDRAAAFEAVQQAHARFGRLDVVVNNAGYGHAGFVEEITEDEARAQIETNVFGALWITQAALPLMRAQGSGHIVQISSMGGVIAFPTYGIYHASKWALEGFSDALAQEVAPFGLKVTLVEPGGYATEWGTSSALRSAPLPAYDDARAALYASFKDVPLGDPAGAARALLRVVDSDDPPLRILLGEMAWGFVMGTMDQRMKTWARWEDVSRSADKA